MLFPLPTRGAIFFFFFERERERRQRARTQRITSESSSQKGSTAGRQREGKNAVKRERRVKREKLSRTARSTQEGGTGERVQRVDITVLSQERGIA